MRNKPFNYLLWVLAEIMLYLISIGFFLGRDYMPAIYFVLLGIGVGALNQRLWN